MKILEKVGGKASQVVSHRKLELKWLGKCRYSSRLVFHGKLVILGGKR